MAAAALVALASGAVAAAPVRVPVVVTNATAGAAAGLPVVVRMVDLPPIPGADWRGTAALDAAGQPIACQVDDLDADGRLGADDELALLLDAPAGESTVYLLPPPSSAAPAPWREPAVAASADPVAGSVTAENGLVRVELRSGEREAKTHAVSCRHGGEWITLASQRIDTVKLDDQWEGWENRESRVALIAAGAVRARLRHTVIKANARSRKTVAVVSDYSVYAGRREIESVLRVVNTSADQVVLLSYAVTGFYDVSPGGAYDVDRDRFAGLLPDGRMVDGALRTTGYHLGRCSSVPILWCAAWPGGDQRPQLGLGWVPIEPLHSVYGAVLADVARGDRHALRLTISHEFRGNTLWPGDGYGFRQWLCPDPAAPAGTRAWAELCGGISVTVGAPEDTSGTTGERP